MYIYILILVKLATSSYSLVFFNELRYSSTTLHDTETDTTMNENHKYMKTFNRSTIKITATACITTHGLKFFKHFKYQKFNTSHWVVQFLFWEEKLTFKRPCGTERCQKTFPQVRSFLHNSSLQFQIRQVTQQLSPLPCEYNHTIVAFHFVSNLEE